MMEWGAIGCGNMGGTLAQAICRALGGDHVMLYDADEAKCRELAARTQATAGTSAAAVAEHCRYLVMGLKPQVQIRVLRELAPHIPAGTTVISMAAGVSLAALEEATAQPGRPPLPLIRIMPNTPAAIGEGVILYATQGTSPEQEEAFCTAFSCAGTLYRIPEGEMDAASALSGCGPAFTYLFLEALADGAVACGIPRGEAQKWAAQTVRGAAGMALCSGETPGALKDAVCSPGGTTIAGVAALEKAAFRGAAMEAVLAAYRRTLELKK